MKVSTVGENLQSKNTEGNAARYSVSHTDNVHVLTPIYTRAK